MQTLTKNGVLASDNGNLMQHLLKEDITSDGELQRVVNILRTEFAHAKMTNRRFCVELWVQQHPGRLERR